MIKKNIMSNVKELCEILQEGIDKKHDYINHIKNPKELINSLTDLDQMIGNEKVKETIVGQINFFIYSDKIQSEDNFGMLNALFYGPPGVGKSETAKKVSRIWNSLGIIKYDKNSSNRKNKKISISYKKYPWLITLLFIIIAIAIICFYKKIGILSVIFLLISLFFIYNFVVNELSMETRYYEIEQNKEDYDNEEKTFNDNEEIFKVVSRENFIDKYSGWTATKTRKLLEESLGKVLFVDEAYSLVNGPNDNFGNEALTEINLFIDRHPNEIIIIFAGYKENLENTVFAIQPGLKRRFMWHFECPGYTIEQLYQIFKLQLLKKNWKIEDDEKTLELFQNYHYAFPAYGGDTSKLAYFSMLEHSKNFIKNPNYSNPILKVDEIEKGIQKLLNNNIEESKSISSNSSNNQLLNLMKDFQQRA